LFFVYLWGFVKKTEPLAKHADEFSQFINLVRFLELLAVTRFQHYVDAFLLLWVSLQSVRSFGKHSGYCLLRVMIAQQEGKNYISRRNWSAEKGTISDRVIIPPYCILYILICAMTVLLYFYFANIMQSFWLVIVLAMRYVIVNSCEDSRMLARESKL